MKMNAVLVMNAKYESGAPILASESIIDGENGYYSVSHPVEIDFEMLPEGVIAAHRNLAKSSELQQLRQRLAQLEGGVA